MNEKLILENINLIYLVINKYRLDQEEYFDIGMIGLVRGANSYDVSKGYALSTYLVKCITCEILKQLQYEQRYCRGKGFQTISIYAPIYNNNKENFILDFIPSDENIEENVIKQEQKELMYKELLKLKERDKFIICSKYGLLGYEEMKQNEIAKKIGISRSLVTRVVKRFIKKVERKYTKL